MKRNIRLILLCLTLSLLMCSCGSSSAAKEVEELINNIGDVTLDSENVILEAEAHYSALTENQKDEITNYYILLEARKKYDKLVYDSQTIKGVSQDLYEQGYNLVEQAFSDDYKKIYDRWSKADVTGLSMKELVRKMEESEKMELHFEVGERKLKEIEQKYVNVVNLFLVGYPDYYMLSSMVADNPNSDYSTLIEVTLRITEMIEQGQLILNNSIKSEADLDEAYDEMYQYLD